ncbi:hypothetical protein Pyn_11431 [Prunus yedoensis var. nudiflora]|uniref:Uncharacterized protein n=1 Tax=Prunus yedoensis var. nudiflora TaxID=2094558 RepID=A0A314Y3M2_PRUYE|nr:hypothetical protein Pyn_11431 [Prunus yedoensis var. nudiflora]
MEGKGSRRLVQAVLIVMTHDDDRVFASTICTALCLKDCKKTLPDPLYYCNLGCTTSICTNLSPEKLDGCADSGSEN